MLPVGSWLHSPNVEKQCLAVLENDEECSQFNDKHHALILCSRPPVTDRIFQGVLLTFFRVQIEKKDILHFSFNHKSKKQDFSR